MKDLNLQMKHELDQWRAAGATSTEQVQGQQNNMQAQLDRLTEIANRHDEEIDDRRGLSDFTHEIVFEREAKYTTLKMIIKSWPQSATYYDRVSVTDWLLQQARVQQHTKQEHGYYTFGRKIVLSPVTIVTFEDQDAHHMFERFADTSFSAKKPFYYWDSYGDYMQHWKGGWRKLVNTNYMGKIDQTINLALITVLHILTSSEQTGYAGKDQLSHRPSDKQIFDLNTKSAVAEATYDKDHGVLAIVLQKNFVEVVRTNWHEAWRVAHRDHPRFNDIADFRMYARLPVPEPRKEPTRMNSKMSDAKNMRQQWRQQSLLAQVKGLGKATAAPEKTTQHNSNQHLQDGAPGQCPMGRRSNPKLCSKYNPSLHIQLLL